MPSPKLLRLAEGEVERVRARLPEDVRVAAEACPVWFESIEDALMEDESLAEDLLGLFEGLSRLEPEPGSPGDMPRIRLFLDNLWAMAGADDREYRREVRITYLHELGHYLGWGEEEIEALGLG